MVYQTWKTKVLPESMCMQIQMMKQQNPDYEFRLFDDAEMDVWMQTHMPSDVVQAYTSLYVGAAKADLWRYCILYKEGGIYLDIDSIILKPICEFVSATDEAVVSRESNEGCFLNWLLAFRPGHPILQLAIEIVIKNIQQRSSDNIVHLTGPMAFTKALEGVLSEVFRSEPGVWYLSDEDFNRELNRDTPIRCKCIGTDFYDATTVYTYALWKMPHSDELYDGSVHWVQESRIYRTDERL